jgi:hypothetical protein
LLGLPWGSSPILPEGWAPPGLREVAGQLPPTQSLEMTMQTHLKYLNEQMLKSLSAVMITHQNRCGQYPVQPLSSAICPRPV